MNILGGDFMTTLMLGAIVLIGLFTIGLIFARLYHRASKERAFVRTGLGGQKVVKDGGAFVLPVFHEVIPVNMNTLKLEVMRNKAESLITKDRMRVDIVAAFFVRVIPSEDGIANAAQTLGQRTLHPDALRELVEDKFVDALRSTAATMTMQLLQDQRPGVRAGRAERGQRGPDQERPRAGKRFAHQPRPDRQGLLQSEQRVRCRRPDPADAGDREPPAASATRSSRTPKSRCARRTSTPRSRSSKSSGRSNSSSSSRSSRSSSARPSSRRWSRRDRPRRIAKRNRRGSMPSASSRRRRSSATGRSSRSRSKPCARSRCRTSSARR